MQTELFTLAAQPRLLAHLGWPHDLPRWIRATLHGHNIFRKH